MNNFLTRPFICLHKYREIIWRTTVNEVRQKYAGSVVGLFWLFLSPVLLMSIYSVIYTLVFRIQPQAMSQPEYLLYLLSGLIPFLGFSESLNTGSTSLVTNKAVLLNTVFPAELVPFRAVLAAQGTTLVGLTLILAGSALLEKISLLLLLIPLVWFTLVLFATGLVWILSLVSLVVRDMQQILAFLTMILLIASPIAYTLDMVSDSIKFLVYVNPLSYYVIALHEIIIYERMPPVDIMVMTVVLGVLSFCTGYWIFQRSKQVIFDYA